MVLERWCLTERQKYLINRLRLRPLYEGDDYLCYSSGEDERKEAQAITSYVSEDVSNTCEGINVAEDVSKTCKSNQLTQASSSGVQEDAPTAHPPVDIQDASVNLPSLPNAHEVGHETVPEVASKLTSRKSARRRLFLDPGCLDLVSSTDNAPPTLHAGPTPSKKKTRLRTKMVLLKKPRERIDVTLIRSPPAYTVTLSGYVETSWPKNVTRLRDHYNPASVRFEFEGPFVDECGCEDLCRQHTCRNGVLGIFCIASSCSFSGLCSNALKDHPSLRLVRHSESSAYAVIADEYIGEGVILGEYLGQLVVRSREQSRGRNNGYYLKMNRKSKSHPRADVYIDAGKHGGITRFLNHSCTPTANFHEVRHGAKHTVVAVTSVDVQPGQEVTVNYGPNLWFVCRCGELTCVHRDCQHLPDP